MMRNREKMATTQIGAKKSALPISASSEKKHRKRQFQRRIENTLQTIWRFRFNAEMGVCNVFFCLTMK